MQRYELTFFAMLAALVFFCVPAAAQNLDFLDDQYLYNSDGYNGYDTYDEDDYENWYRTNELDALKNPNEIVQPNNPTYVRLRKIAELGLLNEQDTAVLKSGKPLTRLEMGKMVSKVLNNYMYWEDTGRIRRMRNITITEEPNPGNPYPGMVRDQHPQTPPKYEQVYPAEQYILPPPSVSDPSLPTQDRKVNVAAPSGEKLQFTKKGPKAMASAPPPPMVLTPAPATTMVRKIEEPPPDPEQPTIQKRSVKVEEDIELTQKLQDAIEELSNSYKKEMKDLDKNVGRKIKDVEKIALKNQRQIEKLKEEDDRFKITGADDFTFYITGKTDNSYDRYTGNIGDPVNEGSSYYGEETRIYNQLTLNFSSKPDPQQDFTLTGTTKVRTELGTRVGYYGYIDNTNTAFSLYEFNVRYADNQDDPKNPRNFKLKSLAVGNVSVGYSPLTMFGTKLQGMTMSLKLNDYSINMFGGRMAYHYPIFLGVQNIHEPGVDTQYDRYVYGMNVAASIFGEQRSMGNFQKIFMYDNFKTNYWGQLFDEPWECRTGFWAQMGYDNDPAAGVGETTDESYKDLFCLPPEKNSVTSAFIRYPVTDKIYITAEYAHSTYYKPGYKAVIGDLYLHPDDYEEWYDYKDGWYVNNNDTPDDESDDKLLDEYGNEYQECDIDDPNEEISGCWLQSKERNDQDDGFLILFDWTKGPIQIFPIGYARLGSEFVTKYFGLPGFDMGSMLGGEGGGGVGFLPIAIQSLELYLTNFSYDKQQEDNYKYSTYYIWGNEIQPMYFDPGLVMYGMSNNKTKGGTMGILAGFVDKINTRRETLRLNAWINNFKYYMSDNMNLDIGYTSINLMLPDTCLDGDIVAITDDYGNLIDRVTGNGIYDCSAGVDPLLNLKVRMQTQSYDLYWKTSKNGESTTTFEISNMDLSLAYTNQGVHNETVENLVLDLVPRGRTFTLKQAFKYKLTGTTTLDFLYQREYDTVDDEYSVLDPKYPVVDNHKLQFKISTTF